MGSQEALIPLEAETNMGDLPLAPLYPTPSETNRGDILKDQWPT